jgi:hypothetical protein
LQAEELRIVAGEVKALDLAATIARLQATLDLCPVL